MKREIGFRAWNGENIIEIDGNSNVVLEYNDISGWNIMPNRPYYKGEYLAGETIGVFVLMQYTGLKDKKGKEIYEGDIIVWSGTLDGCIFNHVCEVIFDLYQWCGWAIYSPQQKSTIPFGEHGCNPNEVNIVGNVYENKELLKTN